MAEPVGVRAAAALSAVPAPRRARDPLPGRLPTDVLVRRSLARLGETAWFTALPADVRSWVGVVVQGGIEAFGRWLADPTAAPAGADGPFDAVPASVTRAVTLEQTVDMVRTVVEVVEASVPELAPDDEARLRSAVERYGREVAFAVARVYARAAEQRGAWDARLQALVVDALVSGDDPRQVSSRAAALGWPVDRPVRVAAVLAPAEGDDTLGALVRAARHRGVPVLAALQGSAVVVVLREQGYGAPAALVPALLPGCPVVLGPVAPIVAAASPSARAALGGLAVLPALGGGTGVRVLEARELLPERALAGEPEARRELVESVHAPLAAAGLVGTVEALLASGGALETAARSLPVHVNTLRQRLARVQVLVGVDPRSPRGVLVLHAALTLARLPGAVVGNLHRPAPDSGGAGPAPTHR